MALPKRSASTETTSATTTASPYPFLLPRPGRPSLFNPERTAAICAIIHQEGISDSAAGALAGVTASTLSRWKAEHEEFALELEVARALFEVDQVRAIRKARKRDGSVDWRAIAWLLKYSSPEGFGPPSRRRKVKGAEDEAPEAERAAEATPQQAQEQQEQPETPREKCAILPEIPLAGRGRPGERANGGAMAPRENCATLPETPDGGDPRPVGPAAPRPSRRERRAAERQQAKQARAVGAAHAD
ncbi:MAG TPA: hypothetical protein VGO11_06420 [Chthoniobacteraceae bacterium]|jgi:hypothetical protein|nr:hypothetical protein [Chthoniobacteraceae bacterium]